MYDLWVVKYRGGKYFFGELKQSPTIMPLPELTDITDPDAVGVIIQDGDTGQVLEQRFTNEEHRIGFFRKGR